MRVAAFIFFLSLFCLDTKAQELFPLNEPASSIPKGVLGLRGMTQFYREYSVTRQMYAARIMYGVTSKLSVEVTGAGSNHHDTLLPNNLLTHTHNASGGTVYTANTPTLGIPYPVRFAGFNFYAKYRILSFDGDKSHFRVALFGDFSTVKAAHDEAEPGLMDDDGGWEAGFIATKLVDRFAVSLTAGYIQPTFSFSETQSQYIFPPQVTQVWYGKAVEYNLSLGYRLLPAKYSSDYSEPNFNVYVEFLGKTYDSATVKINGEVANIKTKLLQAGTYVEMHPGVQYIINSNTRIELSVGYPIINQAYTRFYPVYSVGFQHYFYFAKKK
jgi:hypothetical protein